MKTTLNNHKGAVLIIFAILLIVLIGFVALAVDVGRWYTVRSELSKAVDAASLAGAKNISNIYLDQYYGVADGEGKLRFAEEIGRQNFSPGYLMTTDSPTFTARNVNNQTIEVTGSVTSPGNLASLFGIDQVPTGAVGMARKNKVEIMLVLDRSGSMDGTKINKLKEAASSFVDYFKETEDEDKMGLITFATSVTLKVPLGIEYVDSMKAKISSMSALGATNAEDALAQPLRTGGFTDQTGIHGDLRVQQFLIFFSDGMPTAFRGDFRRRGTNYDAVACSTGNCRAGENLRTYTDLGYPAGDNNYDEKWFNINPTPTGDGSTTQVVATGYFCWNQWQGFYEWCRTSTYTTRWYLFDTRPVPGGYGSTYINIPTDILARHICNVAKAMTLENAQLLKDRGIKIYTIGLDTTGALIDKTFLQSLSSGDNYAYYTSSSSNLKPIFNEIAKEIKLRLVQ